MRVRFWGTRGSLAKPGPSTVRHGGNTSCVEVRAGDTVLMLDCGTGAHGLGLQLMAAPPARREVHLLIGHPHWDHIQGLPFFAPMHDQEWSTSIYAPVCGPRLGAGALVRGLMRHPWFPLAPDDFVARVTYQDLVEGAFSIGRVRIEARYLNHPVVTLGYRLEADGAVVVYATDHEPHLAWSSAPSHPGDRDHIGLLAGADLVIHDTQFALAEYPTRIGWGHAAAEQAVDYCVLAGVRRLALFHHDPHRDDAALDELVGTCAARAAAAGASLEVFAAREGDEVEVAAGPDALRPRPAPGKALGSQAAAATGTALLLVRDASLAALVASALADEGIAPRAVADADEAVRIAAAGAADLLVAALPEASPLLGGQLPLPVLLLCPTTPDGELAAATAREAAMDLLVQPLKATYLRTRLRIWLTRARRGRARWHDR